LYFSDSPFRVCSNGTITTDYYSNRINLLPNVQTSNKYLEEFLLIDSCQLQYILERFNGNFQ